MTEVMNLNDSKNYWTTETCDISFCEIPFDSDEDYHFSEHSRDSVSSNDSIDELEIELYKLCLVDDPWEKYQKRELIGSGSSGKVFRAINTTTGREVAVKQIIIKDQSKKQLILNEICALKYILHPNIMPLENAYCHHHPITCEATISLVSHYCSQGSLTDICGSTVIPENLVATILRLILSALNELHMNRIAHRDIKTDNILLDSDCNLFLSDLGYCDVIDENTMKCVDSSVIGTPYWMAPEGKNNFAFDLFIKNIENGIILKNKIQKCYFLKN